MRFFSPFIRSRFFLAGSLAFFCSLSPVFVKADNVSDIAAAIEMAYWNISSAGASGLAWPTYPEDVYENGVYQYLSTDDSPTESVAYWLSEIYTLLQTQPSVSLTNLDFQVRNMATDVWQAKTLLGYMHELDFPNLSAGIYHIDDTVSNILDSWSDKFYNRATFSGNEELLVHDNMLFEMMQAWYDDDTDHWDDLSDYYNDIQSVYLDNIETAVENMVDSGLGLTFALSNLVEVTQRIYLQLHPVSNDVENIIEDAEQEVQQDMRQGDRDIQDFLDEFEPEYLDDEENYPDTEEQHIAADQTGISAVTNPNNHGTTIKFTNGTSGSDPFVPLMEWDMFRNSHFSSFITQVTTVCHAGWTAFFSILGFMLYYGGYRRARSMLEAAHAGSFVPAPAGVSVEYPSL